MKEIELQVKRSDEMHQVTVSDDEYWSEGEDDECDQDVECEHEEEYEHEEESHDDSSESLPSALQSGETAVLEGIYIPIQLSLEVRKSRESEQSKARADRASRRK